MAIDWAQRQNIQLWRSTTAQIRITNSFEIGEQSFVGLERLG